MTTYLHLLRTSWGRIAAGITLMASVAYLNDGHLTGKVEWRSTMTFLAAFLAWFASCLPEKASPLSNHLASTAATPSAGPPPPTPHDRQLFSNFRALINDHALRFLEQQDMGAAFRLTQIDGIREVADTWRGPDFRFDDAALHAAFVPVLEAIRQFSHEVALKTNVLAGGEVAKLVWNYENEDACRAQHAALNKLASDLYSLLDEFVPLARQQLW